MSDNSATPAPTFWNSPEMKARIRKRYAAERRFKALGLSAIVVAVAALVILLTTIIYQGIGGFFQTELRLPVTFEDSALTNYQSLTPEEQETALLRTDFAGIYRKSLMELFPDVSSRRDVRKLMGLVSDGARTRLRNMIKEDPSLIGQHVDVWLTASDDLDMLMKGHISADLPESERRIKDNELAWIQTLEQGDRLRTDFNWHFFSSGDSREPELAGIWGAAVGSFFTLLVTLGVAFPVGVLAAIYLEEFAPTNRWTDLIEVNINNLAAVPSIVFGLLGLAVFLNTFHLPRSAPLVGGLTLALMTLPTIIISARAAIKAVPPSIRDAARGLGASRVQVVAHHVLPLAMPGILTGTIIGMAQALGETAPLLMIGMVAFIVDIPGGITDAATVLPVQIFLWADSPERAFVEKTSAAIMVLLAFLILMNAVAIWMRQKFERTW